MYRSALSVFTMLALLSAACSTDPNRAKADALTRGNQYFAAHKVNEAILEYRRAVQLDPKFGEARAKLGDAYLESGDVANALRETVRAADLLPDRADVQIKAGNLLLASGSYEDARSRADHVLAKTPQHVEALVLRGNALASLKDLDGALSELEKAAAADPERGLIHTNIGAIEMAKGSTADAEAAFRKATELSPESVLARVSYANFLLAAKRGEAAESELNKALELAPRDPMVRRAFVLLYLSTGRQADAEPHLRALADDSDQPAARFALARFYFASNRRDDAIRELQVLAARKDSYADATLEIAAAQYRAGQPADGRRLLSEVLKQVPLNARARLLDAEFLIAEQKWDDAIAAATAALERDPRLAAAYFVMGQAHQARREFDEAKHAFNEVLRLEPRADRAQLALAELHLRDHDSATAQQFASSAAARAPRSPEARATLIRAMVANQNVKSATDAIQAFKSDFPDNELGVILEGTLSFSRKDFAAAAKAFARAEQMNPKSDAAASGRIQTMFATGSRAEAKQYADRLVAAHPGDAKFKILAARAYATLREFETAEPLLRGALQVDPSRIEAYNMLAQLYLLEGKPEQALAEYQELADARPKSISAATMRGTLLQVTHRRPEAKDAYRKVLAIDPSAPVAANNLAWMLAEDDENLDVALQLAQTAKAGLPDESSAADTLGWIYLK